MVVTRGTTKIHRRSLLAGAGGLAAATLTGANAAFAGTPRQLVPTLPPLPGVTLPPLPGVLGDLLRLVTDLNDLLLLGALVPIDGATSFALGDKVVYADMPGNPLKDQMPHGMELIRYKVIIAKELTRTGDHQLTTTSRMLNVPVDSAGELITTWRNPVDGKLRPALATFNRGYKRVFNVADGRLLLGTPDAVSGAVPAVTTPAGTFMWSTTLFKSHNLHEKFGISEDFGFAGNVTQTMTATAQIATPPASLSILPVSTSCMRQLTHTTPFFPAMAMDPAKVCGQAVARENVVPLNGFGGLPQWLQSYVMENASDLLKPSASQSVGHDDSHWPAFYRDQLEPKNLTWREWCEASVISER